MENEIITYLNERKSVSAKNNEAEFLLDSDTSKASIERMQLRGFQRSVIAVDNIEGPTLAKQNEYNTNSLETINENRIQTLEELLKISKKEKEHSLSERLRIVEDKILWIEEHYPQVAYSCFNYSPDKHTDKKGRVTQVKQYSHPVEANVDLESNTGIEIIRRMEELRKKLKNN